MRVLDVKVSLVPLSISCQNPKRSWTSSNLDECVGRLGHAPAQSPFLKLGKISQFVSPKKIISLLSLSKNF